MAHLLVASFMLLVACSSPPPKAPNPTKPLDERRAAHIILTTLRSEGVRAGPSRSMVVLRNLQLELDVPVAGRSFGIAYVTEREQAALGDSLSEGPPDGALHVVRGSGADSSLRVLLLHATNYVYDDAVGDAHEQTTIVAERRLARDVRDFVVHAQMSNWP